MKHWASCLKVPGTPVTQERGSERSGNLSCYTERKSSVLVTESALPHAVLHDCQGTACIAVRNELNTLTKHSVPPGMFLIKKEAGSLEEHVISLYDLLLVKKYLTFHSISSTFLSPQASWAHTHFLGGHTPRT